MAKNVTSFGTLSDDPGSSYYSINMTSKNIVYVPDIDDVTSSEFQGNATKGVMTISSVKKNESVATSSIMFALGVFGNVLALLVLQRSKNGQKRNIFYRFVAGLTITDLTGTLATSPVVIAVYVNDFKWIGGTVMCKYFGFMMIFAGCATMLVVCMMSIERLVCIRLPYFYHTRLTKTHAIVFLVIAWISSALVASLPFLGFGRIVLQYPYTWCFFDYYTDDVIDRGFNYLFAVFALCTITVTVSCNISVFYTIIKTKVKGLSNGKGGNSRKYHGYSKRYAECQMVVLLIGITLVFSSCYAPLMVRIVINQTKLVARDVRTDLIMIRLASLNQVLDPWVYILLRREVVWKIFDTMKSIFCCRANTKELQMDDFRKNSMYQQQTSVLLEVDNPTCCEFCWHCMCDPPQRYRSSSVMSSYWTELDQRRSTLCPGSPKRLGDLGFPIRNFSSSSSLRNLSTSSIKTYQTEYCALDLLAKKAASTAVITTSPTRQANSKYVVIRNGMNTKRFTSDPSLNEKLLINNCSK